MRRNVSRKILSALLAICAALLLALIPSGLLADSLLFEEGPDGAAVTSSIPEVQLTTRNGAPWIYGDWSTGDYNGPYPDGAYWTSGEFFVWVGVQNSWGVISMKGNSYATSLSIGYSAQNGVVLEAYNKNAELIDSATGLPAINSGEIGEISVSGDEIAYAMVRELSDYGNYWMVDSMEIELVHSCDSDADCDDGSFCNRVEICRDFQCRAAGFRPCGDDGLWCTGVESCDELNNQCLSTGSPCGSKETCNEVKQTCDPPKKDASDGDDEDFWPKGDVSGGCCGC